MKQYRGLYILIAVISLATYVGVMFRKPDMYMTQFMGRWFLLFGLTKVWNRDMFASLFKQYDIIAHKSSLYASKYPFLEIGLGLSYLFMNMNYIGSILILTIVVCSSTARGIILYMRNGKKMLQCACLGSAFTIPLGRVSLGEQLLMVGMALVMLYIDYSFFNISASLFGILGLVLISIMAVAYTHLSKTIAGSKNTLTNSQGNLEQINISHNGTQFIPSSINLAKGINYQITVTPTSNGKGCMDQVVIPGKGPIDIIKDVPFVIEVDGSIGTIIPLLCSSMGMKQGEIIVK